MNETPAKLNKSPGAASYVCVGFACLALLCLCALLLLGGTAPEAEAPEDAMLRVSLLSPPPQVTAAPTEEEPALQLVEVSSGTAHGKLLIVRDPRSVVLSVTEPMGFEPGQQITELVARRGGVAGVNAGGYEDDSGRGNGRLPVGLVISEGKILWGAAYGRYHVVGLDGTGKLIVGEMSGREALDAGILWAVSFYSVEGNAAELIVDGQIQKQNMGRGVNPRTAIGQRADGTLLLLVLDGRGFESLGATMDDLVRVLQEYGAVTAGNLDGGASSVMAYEGEIVSDVSSVTGARAIPTAFVVLPEGAYDG